MQPKEKDVTGVDGQAGGGGGKKKKRKGHKKKKKKTAKSQESIAKMPVE